MHTLDQRGQAGWAEVIRQIFCKYGGAKKRPEGLAVCSSQVASPFGHQYFLNCGLICRRPGSYSTRSSGPTSALPAQLPRQIFGNARFPAPAESGSRCSHPGRRIGGECYRRSGGPSALVRWEKDNILFSAKRDAFAWKLWYTDKETDWPPGPWSHPCTAIERRDRQYGTER